jgi:hypothetical protein
MSWMIRHADALRDAAQARRNQGLATGKSAKGWDVRRPDPVDEISLLAARLKATFREHCNQVMADYQAAAYPERELPF